LDKQEVLASVQRDVDERAGGLLTPGKCWQPSDFVPDLSSENWLTELESFREASRGISDELLVVLVGSTITEEALPAYQTSLNRLEGIGDESGDSASAWGKWSRGWTAEENRHGDLLNRYLYLCGRVDMRAVEESIQHLLRNGFNPQHSNDPYNGLVYTSFQERATKLAHCQVARLSRAAGDESLMRICNVIAADEARHEDAYKAFMTRVFELDPAGSVLAMETMLTRTIRMPAHLMSDPEGDDLFACFSNVAQNLGVYTFSDYISVIDHLIDVWSVDSIPGLSGAAAEAQDRICRMPIYYRKRADWMEQKLKSKHYSQYPWINGINANLQGKKIARAV
jgi:acyl-[acyl-carrier-protein] desaturase